MAAPQRDGDSWTSLLRDDEQSEFTAADVAFEHTTTGADALHCLHARYAKLPAFRPGFRVHALQRSLLLRSEIRGLAADPKTEPNL
jgi:hypothetical protein